VATRSGVRDRLLSKEVALPEGRVAVKLFAGVKAAFGRPQVSVEFGEGSDLHSVLLTACDTPARRRALFLDSGDLRPELQVLVNGRNINFLHGLRTVLKSGDEVAVFPPMYGG
jgi:sulfur-carrier protein